MHIFRNKIFRKSSIFPIFLLLINICFTLEMVKSVPIDSGLHPTASDEFYIEFYCSGPAIHGEDKLNIYIKQINYTYSNLAVPKGDLVVHKYHVYNSKTKDQKVLTGDLVYNEATGKWEKLNIVLFWSGVGEVKFYVTVEFKNTTMQSSYETDIIDDDLHSYVRTGIIEILIITAAVIGVIVGSMVLILVIRMKKQSQSMKRKIKEKKGDIKITQISKDELKKATKKAEKKENKEKGKTEVQEDLIFSVPKWELDEEND